MAPGGSPDADPATGLPMGVLSTIELSGSGYSWTYYAGTSQATPFVAGTIALMRAVHPRLSAVEARRILQATANPSAKCANPDDPTTDGCGAGLLAVDAAVNLAAAGDEPADPRLGNVMHGGCTAAGNAPDDASLLLPLLAIAFALAARAITRA